MSLVQTGDLVVAATVRQTESLLRDAKFARGYRPAHYSPVTDRARQFCLDGDDGPLDAFEKDCEAAIASALATGDENDGELAERRLDAMRRFRALHAEHLTSHTFLPAGATDPLTLSNVEIRAPKTMLRVLGTDGSGNAVRGATILRVRHVKPEDEASLRPSTASRHFINYCSRNARSTAPFPWHTAFSWTYWLAR